ncbi:protein of unassigned function [Methylobacterium oryzae CBMB20]|uniref:Protein of unassigned function n=1 Tax=Methylobacterium oryzae CBMB20 TaxID=693986 RepID=A0A089Q3C2_9HYPH|nr:protein of unassigned function [Methylobacterium oryzae CBMB20]
MKAATRDLPAGPCPIRSRMASRADPDQHRRCWYKVYLNCSSQERPLVWRERTRQNNDLELARLAGRPGAAQARGGAAAQGLGTGAVMARGE